MELINLLVICTLIVLGVKLNKYVIYGGLTKHNLQDIYYNLTSFIGVPIHELSHLIFCKITGAKVKCYQLYDMNTKSGYVRFVKRGPKIIQHLQSTLSGIAPIICGIFLCIVLQKLLIPDYNISLLKQYVKTKEFWIYAFITSSIVFNMDLSKADLKHVFKGIYIPLIILTILYFIDCDIINMISWSLVEIIKTLSIPIIIPFVITLFLIIV